MRGKAQLAKGKLQDTQIAALMSQVKALQTSLKINGHTDSKIRTIKAQLPIIKQ
jgi:hypothetical protein